MSEDPQKPKNTDPAQTEPDLPADDPQKSVENLKKALQAERKNSRDLAAKLKEIDIDEYAELKKGAKAAAEAEQKRLEAEAAAKGDIEALRDKMKESIQQKESAHQEREAALLEYIRKVSVEEAGKDALIAAGGNATLLMPFVRERTKVEESDGSFKVVVLDEDGSHMFTNDGSSATLADLVASMRNDNALAQAFEGSGRTGSGITSGGGTPAPTPSSSSRRDLSVWTNNLDDIMSGKRVLTD